MWPRESLDALPAVILSHPAAALSISQSSAPPALSRDGVRAAASAILKAQRKHRKTLREKENMTPSPMIITSKQAEWEGQTQNQN